MKLKRFLRFWVGSSVFAGVVACLATGCALLANGAGTAAPLPPSAILATIPVGNPPTYLAMAQDGTGVFAASSGSLTVIETSGNTALAKLPIEANSSGVAITPDGLRVLVTSLFSLRMTVLDTASTSIVAPIALIGEGLTGGFGRIAVRPDGSEAWVVNEASEVLDLVPLDGSATHSIDLDMRPADIAFSPDGRLAYVAGCKDQCVPGTVAVFDTAQRTMRGYIPAGTRPYRIAMAPDGARFYSTGLGDSALSVVDVASRSVIQTVSVGVEPTGLSVARDGSIVYVSSQEFGTVTAIDAATYAVLNTLRVGDQAREVLVTPDGRRLYVSTQDSVLVVDSRAFRPQ